MRLEIEGLLIDSDAIEVTMFGTVLDLDRMQREEPVRCWLVALHIALGVNFYTRYHSNMISDEEGAFWKSSGSLMSMIDQFGSGPTLRRWDEVVAMYFRFKNDTRRWDYPVLQEVWERVGAA